MALSSSDNTLAARTWLERVARDQRGLLNGAAFVLACDALAAVGLAAGLAKAITTASQGLDAAGPWVLLLVVSILARSGLAHASALAGGEAAAAAKTIVRAEALGTVLAGPGQTIRQSLGSLMTVAIEGVEALDGYFARFWPARRASLSAPILVLCAIAFASPVSAAILLITYFTFCGAMAFAGVAAAKESRRQFQALERLSGLFLDRVRALPVILAFQAEAREAAALSRAAEDLRRRTSRVLRRAFLSSGVLEFFAALSVASVAIYCGSTLLGTLPFEPLETLDLGQAIFVLALAPEVYAPLRRLSAAYHERQTAEAAAAALARMKAPPLPRAAATICTPPRIRFEAVAIRYPEADVEAIKNFNLDIAPGSTVALMGASGVGKTSLLHLLLGLAPLTEGEVWIADQRLSEVGGVAAAVAWAGQAPLVIPGSLVDNLALARRSASRAEIEAVAARVGLGDAIGRRSEGLDVLLNERGGGLSGGERRRLALGRALLKPAPILLLDEPTANLDLAAERALLPVITEACRDRTAVIATHSELVAGLADLVVRL